MTAPAFADVIGDPIAQSKSPIIHKFWLQKLGMAGDYRAVLVTPTTLAAYFARHRLYPNWRGCNVTIPHKQAVLALVDRVSDTVRAVGAANCIQATATGLFAENTDVEGVLAAINWSPGRRQPGITCLVGAGGAARAALHALRLAGVQHLRLLARRPTAATGLLAEFGMTGRIHDFDAAETAFSRCQTIINASPLGMTGQPAMPAPLLAALSLVDPAALVFDMVYAPLETSLLATARSLGRQSVDGLTMLIGQADMAFQLFFGAVPPRQHDTELRALLSA